MTYSAQIVKITIASSVCRPRPFQKNENITNNNKEDSKCGNLGCTLSHDPIRSYCCCYDVIHPMYESTEPNNDKWFPLRKWSCCCCCCCHLVISYPSRSYQQRTYVVCVLVVWLSHSFIDSFVRSSFPFILCLQLASFNEPCVCRSYVKPDLSRDIRNLPFRVLRRK